MAHEAARLLPRGLCWTFIVLQSIRLQTPLFSSLIVVMQLLLLGALALPWSAASFSSAWSAVPLAAGAATAAWTLSVNPPSNFSVFPQPRPGARLVTSGPYRYVRHPMYLAVVLFAGGVALGWHTLLHGFAFTALALVLHLKVGMEEAALAERFPEYRDYRDRTPRWLPFIR